MKIAIGSDHVGWELKEHLKGWLAQAGHEAVDLGTDGKARVDYPDCAEWVGRAVVAGECEQGILICGTGIGISIAANKIRGIRAALCHDAYTAGMARRHNDANILCLGAMVVGRGVAEDALCAWLNATYEGGRHQIRVDKIARLETKLSDESNP
jgi:ribose 5-phosphate isomerase B